MRPVEVGLNDGKVYFTKETTIQKEKRRSRYFISM